MNDKALSPYPHLDRKITYSMMVSLDGYLEGPDHDLGWVIIEEELHKYINEQEKSVDTYLHGRRMYELMAEYWPTADENPANPDYIVEFSRIWKKMPKIVFSKTLDQVSWNAKLAREINPGEIIRMKAQPGMDMEVAGAEIAGDFLQLGLVDEVRLYVQPVILGSGTPMFPHLDYSIRMNLIETRTFKSGVVLLRYQLHENGSAQVQPSEASVEISTIYNKIELSV